MFLTGYPEGDAVKEDGKGSGDVEEDAVDEGQAGEGGSTTSQKKGSKSGSKQGSDSKKQSPESGSHEEDHKIETIESENSVSGAKEGFSGVKDEILEVEKEEKSEGGLRASRSSKSRRGSLNR